MKQLDLPANDTTPPPELSPEKQRELVSYCRTLTGRCRPDPETNSYTWSWGCRFEDRYYSVTATFEHGTIEPKTWTIVDRGPAMNPNDPRETP